MSWVSLLNSAWMFACRRESHAFEQATRHVAETQADLLRSIVAANRHSDFGREHSFAAIGSVVDFQRQVPVGGYDKYRLAIDRIAAGETNVLTSEPVELFEPTSGSTAGEKWIPYTRTLRQQFQRGVKTWIADLFHQRPAVRQGRAYWSISPALGPARRTPGGIPIGFDDDAAYLSRWEQWAVRRVLAAPGQLARVANLQQFRYLSLLHLLAAEDLSLISVWNPTFLTTLLMPLEELSDRIPRDLQHGLADWPWLPRSPRRASQVAAILRSASKRPEMLRELWPNLALISCWGDAASFRQLNSPRELFPDIEIQPKGLLATEGFVSIPLVDRAAPALALRSHFFEFVEAGSTLESGVEPRMRLAHHLQRGGRYHVIITTGGGLYRYPLHDEIEVVGFLNECPLMRFLGKADRTSDLVGEKLSEVHVHHVIERTLAAVHVTSSFAMLAPVEGDPPRYCLYLESPVTADVTAVSDVLCQLLEQGLCENPHYRYAVGLGQIRAATIQWLDPNVGSAAQCYQRRCLARGMRAGAIKSAALDRSTDWSQWFAPAIDRPALATADRPG